MEGKIELIDLAPFNRMLSEADRDFRIDVSYAVAVAKSARHIAAKKAQGEDRIQT